MPVLVNLKDYILSPEGKWLKAVFCDEIRPVDGQYKSPFFVSATSLIRNDKMVLSEDFITSVITCEKHSISGVGVFFDLNDWNKRSSLKPQSDRDEFFKTVDEENEKRWAVLHDRP